MYFALFLLLSFSCRAVLAQYDYGPGYGTNQPTSSTIHSTPSSSAGPSTTAASANTQDPATDLTGDKQCSQSMCITAVVQGDVVEYTLQSTGVNKLGWMAMGFGTGMSNAAMVIMWPNSDGSITLSQRRAPAEVMPTLDSNPPRMATLLTESSDITGNKPKMTFSIPANSDTKQNIIYAFGTRPPSSSAPSATLQQHVDNGPLILDLTKPMPSSSSPDSSQSSPTSVAKGPALLPYQKMVIAHAVFCVFGFLFILPTGVLLARFFRTFSHSWFKGHWILQFGIAGPVIFTGIMLGIAAVATAGAGHVDDVHKKWGIVLLVLYLMQCTLGGVIHFIKPKGFIGRPPQNFLHAIIGLSIIGLAFYQVRTGYKFEWPNATGLADLPKAVDYVWYTWVVLLPVLYVGGLSLLRRQYKQERESRRKADAAHYYEIGMSGMNTRY